MHHSYLETSWTPINKLDGSLGLDGGNRSINILGYNITSVQHTAGHVFAVTWVTFHHLVDWFKTSVGDLGDGQLLVESFLCRDDRGVCTQREVDTWVGYQVGLELGQVDVECTIESEGSSDRGDDLANQSVEVAVGWSCNVQVPATYIVDGLVVYHKGAVGVFQCGVGGEDSVIRLYHSRGYLGSWVDGELELRLLSIVDTEPL